MTSLRRRMIEDMQVRNLSPHTQDSYVQQVSLFARHFTKSPEVLGPEEIRSYQLYLTNEKKLAPSSILSAATGLIANALQGSDLVRWRRGSLLQTQQAIPPISHAAYL
jgi:Phage integrase, N-terminal SAM-like domain